MKHLGKIQSIGLAGLIIFWSLSVFPPAQAAEVSAAGIPVPAATQQTLIGDSQSLLLPEKVHYGGYYKCGRCRDRCYRGWRYRCGYTRYCRRGFVRCMRYCWRRYCR